MCIRDRIYCTLSDGLPKAYDIEIVKRNKNSTDTKNFVIRVTDEKLLSETGGIVQGMSGSPILQNGKLIGAVTHVLINDPTRGYGCLLYTSFSSSMSRRSMSTNTVS